MWVSNETRRQRKVMCFGSLSLSSPSSSLVVSQCNLKFYVPCASIFSYVSIKHWNSIFFFRRGRNKHKLEIFSYYFWNREIMSNCIALARRLNFVHFFFGWNKFLPCVVAWSESERSFIRIYCETLLRSLWAFSTRLRLIPGTKCSRKSRLNKDCECSWCNWGLNLLANKRKTLQRQKVSRKLNLQLSWKEIFAISWLQ